jgi:hypothetical protein
MTEPTATRFKLEIARYFLKRIDAIVGKGGPETPPELAYYADAFISTARSVTFVMKCEYGHCEGFDAWHDQFPTEDERPLLKRTAKLRNESQKQAPLRPTLQAMIAPVVGGPSRLEFMEGIGWVHVPTTVKVFWIAALGNMEFHATFSRYVEYLERLVTACEGKFHRRPEPITPA